jgi:hypothetical protein
MADREHPAVRFSDVLRAELDHIEDSRQKRGVRTPVPYHSDPQQCARHAELLGLAFSGGGIRSATFNLGVLQGLAEHGVLQEVDYLSTVSGGGYIGAWLLSLLKENGKPSQVEDVQDTLKQKSARHPEHRDQDPIHVLRQFSNYLTPRLIFYSADVWTMVAIWTRNTLLNLLLLIAAIATPLLIAKLLGFWFFVGAGTWEVFSVRPDELGTVICLLFPAVCICGNLLTQRIPRVREWLPSFKDWGQWKIQVFVVCFLLGAGLCLSHWLRNTPGDFAQDDAFLASIGPPWIFLSGCFLAVCLSGGMWECFKADHPGGRYLLSKAAGLAILASVVPGFVTALLLWGAAAALKDMRCDDQYGWLLLTWGPPAALVGLALGEIVQLGIVGRDLSEGAREWFSRLRAWSLIYSFGWVIVFGASIYGPLWMEKLWNAHPWAGAGLTSGWIATTIGGIFSAKSSATRGTSGMQGESAGGNPLVDWIARVAPFVFIAGFLLAIACGVHFLLTWGLDQPPAAVRDVQTEHLHVTRTADQLSVDVQVPVNSRAKGGLEDRIANYFQTSSDSAAPMFCFDCERHFLSAPLNLLLVLLAVVSLLAFRLDINVFSLHEFYKNRLVRCYLGATRRNRRPDSFTGFDERDDVLLKQFHSRDRDGRYFGPYPIVNATMNVSSGQNLAWQQRKSIPFIFTPRYSGYNVEGGNEAMRLGQAPEARGSLKYAYRPTEAYCYPKGIHLGTAVAVSGAAANPNQGYHTSTAVAFLMTVFDVRLGWWVGNPRDRERHPRESAQQPGGALSKWGDLVSKWSRTYDRATPRFNLTALASELFGVTDADSGYVNLSDGGHFDNMGLYELVRRRCRYIIVSDAEQDAELAFGSMTTVLRNCRTDFGVEIKISLNRIIKDEKGYSQTHCVVGRIEYPEDHTEADAKPGNRGFLLYLKSSLTGDEPADVLGYRAEHPEFPHQTTADQWFTEAQFESYRMLGFHIADSALGSLEKKPNDRERYFKYLEDVWYPTSENVERFSAEHSARFSELTLSIGEEDRLAFLDPQVFADWSRREMGIWQRKAKYQVGALIDFMHTVYRQLNLESEHERLQPHNQGWLRIFSHWVKQPDFEDTWKRAQNMFGTRFVEFYEGLKKYDDKG